MSAPGRLGDRPSPTMARIMLGVLGALFLVPIIAMIEFTFRDAAGGYSGVHWVAIVDPDNARAYRNLFQGIGNSLLLAGLTVLLVWVLFLPTIVLVHLGFPRLRRAFELLTVLPIAIPAIALVVGFAPVFRSLAQALGGGVWTLSLAYGILVLPFAYRAIAASLSGMDARTLSEAARTLGAGWGTVLLRVLVPGLRRGLAGATLITVAVVLGEFTVSSLLNRVTLQTALLQVSKSDPYVAVIMSLLSLVIVFVLLVAVGAGTPVRERRAARRKQNP